MGVFTEHWYCPTPIPVTERLPPPGVPVLAWNQQWGRTWTRAIYHEEYPHWHEATEFQDFGQELEWVTHWIELPPHPEAGKW